MRFLLDHQSRGTAVAGLAVALTAISACGPEKPGTSGAQLAPASSGLQAASAPAQTKSEPRTRSEKRTWRAI